MAKSGWEKWRESKRRKAKREAKKAAKRAHIGYIITAVVALFIGLAGGWFGTSYVTRNDVFEINGEKTTVCSVGDTVKYTDEGINYVSFGTHLSDAYEIETSMTRNSDGSYSFDTSKTGTYVMTYRITSGRCKGQTLYRVFTVTDGSEA